MKHVLVFVFMAVFTSCSAGKSEPLSSDFLKNIFYISSVYSNKCVSQTNASSVSLDYCNSADEQKAEIFFDSNHKKSEIIFSSTGNCLSVTGAQRNGSILKQAPCNKGEEQRFAISKRDGAYVIQSSHGLCLDVKDWQRHHGSELQLWKCEEQANQRFFLNPAVNENAKTPLVIAFQTKDYKKNPADHTNYLVKSL